MCNTYRINLSNFIDFPENNISRKLTFHRILQCFSAVGWQSEGHPGCWLTIRRASSLLADNQKGIQPVRSTVTTVFLRNAVTVTRWMLPHRFWQHDNSMLSLMRNTVVLQRFDALGWATGRASGLWKLTASRTLVRESRGNWLTWIFLGKGC